MDKDEYFKIQEEECSYNIMNYFTDFEWAIQNSIAHSSFSEENKKLKKSDSDKQLRGNLSSSGKQAIFNYNMIKDYEIKDILLMQKIFLLNLKPIRALLAETEFFQKFQKISESKKLEKSHKQAVELSSNREKFWEKRISYIEKLINSHASFRYKYNKLEYHSNYQLEKYSVLKEYSLQQLPGLKPSSSWPVNLNYLISKLYSLEPFQMFHQPFDIRKEFYSQAIEFIEKYYKNYLEACYNILDTNVVKSSSTDCEVVLYEEYLIKAIATVLTIQIMQGDFAKILKFLNFLKILFTTENPKYANLEKNKLNNKIIAKVISTKTEENEADNLPKTFIKNIIAYINENKILPIMRNYAIYDIYSLPKNILFTPIRHIFSQSSTITTDSTYLYILISGINGGMIKLGTGYNNTIKGKVYLHVKFTESNLLHLIKNAQYTKEEPSKDKSTVSKGSNPVGIPMPISKANTTIPNNHDEKDESPGVTHNQFINSEEAASYQWIYLKNKLYLKKNVINISQGFYGSSSSSSVQANAGRETNYLIMINPENFRVEGKIKIVFPENCRHPAIKNKNENYVLLSDGEKINILLLEPIFKDKQIQGLKNNMRESSEIVSDNSESDGNEPYIQEIVQKEVAGNKKSKYASYAAAHIKETLPNFQQDLISYLNLTLLTYSVEDCEKLKDSNSIKGFRKNANYSKTQLGLINELYENYSNLYSPEECRKALILNDWKIDQAALFLCDNEKEIKQPLLISDNSTLLFQTKINSINTRNNRVEFKIEKNPYFDVTQFESLKWSITKDFVLGYKLKEGACLVFSTNPNHSKNLNYTFIEKIKSPNSAMLLQNPTTANNLGKKNKGKINVMWRDSIYEKVNIPNNNNNKHNSSNNSKNKKFLIEEISLERKILESIKQEQILEARLLANAADPGLVDPAYSKDIASSFVNPNDDLNIEDINSFNNHGLDNTGVKLVNTLKNIKSMLRGNLLNKPSFVSPLNPNNNSSANNLLNKSIIFNKPFSTINVSAGNTNNIKDKPNNNPNTSSVIPNLDNFVNNSNINTSNSTNLNSNFYLNQKEEILKLLQNDEKNLLNVVKNNNRSGANKNNFVDFSVNRNVKANDNPGENFGSFNNNYLYNQSQNKAIFFEDKKKKNKKKIKEPIYDPILSVQVSTSQKDGNKTLSNATNQTAVSDKTQVNNFASSNIDVNSQKQIDENSLTKENEKEQEIIINETLKGTYIKVIPCIQLAKIDPIFCYDNKNKIYYLLSNSSISLSLMTCNTFIHDAKLMQNLMEDQEVESKDIEIMSFIEELNSFIYENQTEDLNKNKNIHKNYLEDLIRKVKILGLIISNNKQEMPWKYSNWNFFYINFYQAIHLKLKDYSGYENYSYEYSYPLLPSILEKLENQNSKILIKKIDQSTEESEKEFYKKLNFSNTEDNKISTFFNIDESRKIYYDPISATKYESDHYANWNNNSFMLIESKNEISEESQKLNFINKRKHYLNIEASHANLNNIIQELHNHIEEIKSLKLNIEKSNRSEIRSCYQDIWLDLTIAFYWCKNCFIVKDTKIWKNTLKKFENILHEIFAEIRNSETPLFKEIQNQKILNMIIKIILCGWYTVCFDVQTQMKWFYIVFDHSQSLEICKRFSSSKEVKVKFEISNKINIEQAIAGFDINLFNLRNLNNDNKAFNQVTVLPLEILFNIIAPEQPNNLLFNFDRINVCKIFELINVNSNLIKSAVDSSENLKEIKNNTVSEEQTQEKFAGLSKVNKYITRAYSLGLNPKISCFPFYLILFGTKLENKVSKIKTVVETILRDYPKIRAFYLSEEADSSKNELTNLSSDEIFELNKQNNTFEVGNKNNINKEIIRSKKPNRNIIEFGSISNNSYNLNDSINTINYAFTQDFMEGFDKYNCDISGVTSLESLYVKVILKYLQTIKISPILYDSKEKMTKENQNLIEVSNKLWQFLTNAALIGEHTTDVKTFDRNSKIQNSNLIIDFISNSFFCVLGDLDESIKHRSLNKSLLDDTNMVKSNEIIQNQKMFILNNIDFLKKILHDRRNIKDIFFKNKESNNNCLAEECEYDKQLNLPFLKFASFTINTLVSRSSIFIEDLKIKNSINEIINIFSDIITAFAGINLSGPDPSPKKLKELRFEKIFTYLNPISYDGKNTQNEKNFDFLLDNEIIQINETVKIPDNHLMCVEIHFILESDKPINYDLVLVSEDHSYNSLASNTNNNLNNFGTCFLLKLDSTFTKTLYLIGRELKILSPVDYEFGKQGIQTMRSNFGYMKNKNIQPVPKSQKSVLKIKCYPYKCVDFLLMRRPTQLPIFTKNEDNRAGETEILESSLEFYKLSKFIKSSEVNKLIVYYILDYLKIIDHVRIKLAKILIKSLPVPDINSISKDRIISSADSLNDDNSDKLAIAQGLNNKVINFEINLKADINENVIRENSKKFLLEPLIKNGLKVDLCKLLNNSDDNFTFNLKEILNQGINLCNSNNSSTIGMLGNRKGVFGNTFSISEKIENNNYLSSSYRNKIFANKFPLYISSSSVNTKNNNKNTNLSDKSSMENSYRDGLIKQIVIAKQTFEEINKENNYSELTSFYFAIADAIKNKPQDIFEEEIIRVIKLLNKLFLYPSCVNNIDTININIDFVNFIDAIENEMKETLALSTHLKAQIRLLVQEPMNYRSIKFFHSFTKQLKLAWSCVESLIILILIEYLGLKSDLFDGAPVEVHYDNFSLVQMKNETLIFLGNKTNLILNWMSGKVQQMKDTYDSIKTYIELILELKEKSYNKIKNRIIEAILTLRNSDNVTEIDKESKEVEKEKQKGKVVKFEGQKAQPNATSNIQSKNKLPSSNIKGKPKNFKKKQNVKRLYQDLNKTSGKKPTKDSTDSKTAKEENPNINPNQINKQLKNDLPIIEEAEEDLTSQKLNEFSIIQLLNKFSSKLKNNIYFEKEEWNTIQEEINKKIGMDIQEAYSGNAMKLKAILEVNELKFDENNLNESIKTYTKFLKDSLEKYLVLANLSSFESLFLELDKAKVLKAISHESPYYLIGFKVLEKLLFIFELNSHSDLKILTMKQNRKVSVLDKNKINNNLLLSNEANLEIGRRMNSITSNSSKGLSDLNNTNTNLNNTLILNLRQQKILDSIYNIIHGKLNINITRNLMLDQSQRIYFRQIGLNSLNNLFVNYPQNKINCFKTLPGILSTSLLASLEENVETATQLRAYDEACLFNILINFVNIHNNIIDNILFQGTQQISVSLESTSDLFQEKNLNVLKNYVLQAKKMKDLSKISNISEAGSITDTFQSLPLQPLGVMQTSYELEILNFILSDLIILLKSFNENLAVQQAEKSLELEPYQSSFEHFITKSLQLIYYHKETGNLKTNKNIRLISEYKENLLIVLSKLVCIKCNGKEKQTYFLREIIFDNLFSRLRNLSEKNNQQDAIIYVLEIIYNLSRNFTFKSEVCHSEGHSYDSVTNCISLVKGFETLYSLIIKSDIQQIITLACNILKTLLKNFLILNKEASSNNNTEETRNIVKQLFNAIFEKLGTLIVFKNKITNLSEVTSLYNRNKHRDNFNINTNCSSGIDNNNFSFTDDNDSEKNKNLYYVLVQMNSPDIDYQFLVNALFYWEEKYPTKASLYKYKTEFSEYLKDKSKEKEILERLIINDITLIANNTIGSSGQKTKMYNYFNPLKEKLSKISYLEKIVDERNMNIKKAIDEANKLINNSANNLPAEPSIAVGNTNSSTIHSNVDSLKETVFKLRQQEAYHNRIKEHIKLAEAIGETASVRGYVCMEPPMSKQKAEEFAKILHKAYNHLLPHFKSNVDEKINLFPDELIYPKMPDKDVLLPGCTTILKETTASYMNVTICKKEIFEKIENSQKGFIETIKKNVLNKQDDKRIKGGIYANTVFGLSNGFLNSINYNDTSKYKPVINNQCAFGSSISMMIQELIDLFYEIIENRTRTNNVNAAKKEEKEREKDSLTIDFIEILCDNLKNLTSIENWKNKVTDLEKRKLLGMLLLSSDYYGIIRENTNAIFNKNSENVCKILHGGHKFGRNKCSVLFTNKTDIIIEKIDLKNLEKKKNNFNLINKLPLLDIFEAVIKAFEIYRDNRDSLVNKMIFHLSLKILQDVKLDNEINHELIYNIYNDQNNENRKTLLKLIDILKSNNNECVWLEKEDLFWEEEFVDSFERIYDRLYENSDLIYSPVFHFAADVFEEHPIEYKKNEGLDLITNFNLPDSNYKKYLTKINDMSKFQTALANIINFDRYIVGEIFNYCKSQYRDDEYLNSLYQIRYHLSIGDTISAKGDINTIFDNNKMPQNIILPRDHYDNKEITKENCFPGNFYLAKLSNAFLSDTKIKGLKKKENIGIQEIPVLLLLIDNSINQALVLYNDINYSRAVTFWVNIDDLSFLDSQIKMPANSFKISELVKELNYLEKRLRILFCKNILFKFMKILAIQQKFSNFEEMLLFMNLHDWSNFKLNPISGVFRKFKNFIPIKKNLSNMNNIGSISNFNQQIENSEVNRQVDSSKPNGAGFFNLNELISSCSEICINKNKFENSITETKKIYKSYNIENLLNELKINEKPVNDLIIQWCIDNWNQLDNHFLKIKTDLFAEYNIRYDGKLRTKEMFHIGNLNKKMLALHELCRFDISNFAGIILSFEQAATLGPHAKISFYSDPYGENLVDEIYSIKTTKNNLETVIFNYPKIWMHYTPGTRAFYIFEWFMTNRDSYLPCSIVFVPHIWTKLISVTDYSTGSLFSDLNVKFDNFEILAKFIRKLLNHCCSVSLPSELQRRVFNITNRAILKASKFLSLLEQQKKINFKSFSISKKFNILGIDEFALMRLIDLITKFDAEQKDKSFSSAFIVEGVEIILSILAVIKEPFNILDKYLSETFNYILPVRIEAIIKLGQFLNFFQGSASLEGLLMKEIYDQVKIDNQFNDLILIENIYKDISDDIIYAELRNIFISCKAKIIDFDKDVKIFNQENSKVCFALIDGFIIEDLAEKVEEIKEPEPVDEFWECFYCHMENDKDNTFCIFCDKNKKVKPKEKPQKKSNLIKTISYDYTLQESMNKLVNLLKDLNNRFQLPQAQTQLENSANLISLTLPSINATAKNNIIFNNAKTLKTTYKDLLNKFLEFRTYNYASDYDYILQKIKIINNSTAIRNALKSQINYLNELSESLKIKANLKINSPHENNIIDINNKNYDYILFFECLQNNGIDLWFENVILDSQSRNKEIDVKILEKLREFIDIKICKEKSFSLNLQALCLRFVPSHLNSINCYQAESLETYSKDFRNLNIAQIRFYWTIIKYFNNCLCAALPIIKPPDAYLSESNLHDNEEEYIHLPFPKSMSAFLSSSRGIAFSITKKNLIRDIINYTEFSEEQVQIPTFIFERLNIKNNLDNTNIISKKVTNAYARGEVQNFNFKQFFADSNVNNNYANNYFNNSLIANSRTFMLGANNPLSDESNLEKLNKQQKPVKDLSSEESIFIQAFEQAKDIDPAFFRSKKMPGDPHVGFKVEFKGEHVVGIGGPYRQFFSDISAELQSLDDKNKKLLQLLHPTSNNMSGKGEYKDKFCITPSYDSNSALLYYEFLGLLMGICIRTGVHLTLDLCSLTWKKILSQVLMLDDIIEFDEGLYETIIFLTNPNLSKEEFDSTINLSYSIQLTDGKIYELIPNGSEEKVKFEDRFKYLELCLKSRLCEADSQISMVKKGLCKIIPEPLLKLLTYKELERLICGVKTVDLELLRANTKLSPDLNENSDKVKWLWEILNEFSDEEKIKFVKFCWAQERLPSTHEEFQKLQVGFMIKSYMDKTKKDLFPKADTCFFSIELPEYSCKDIMKKKILQAINLDNVSINADKVVEENINVNHQQTYNFSNNYEYSNSEYEDEDYIID